MTITIAAMFYAALPTYVPVLCAQYSNNVLSDLFSEESANYRECL